jgi:hypothetical protein
LVGHVCGDGRHCTAGGEAGSSMRIAWSLALQADARLAAAASAPMAARSSGERASSGRMKASTAAACSFRCREISSGARKYRRTVDIG